MEVKDANSDEARKSVANDDAILVALHSDKDSGVNVIPINKASESANESLLVIVVRL